MKKKSKEFIQLQKEWYGKLEEDGFEDIEYFSEKMEPQDIQKKDTYKHSLEISDKYEKVEEHYHYARQLNHTDLIPEKDRPIWELYSEGISYRNIAAELGTNYTKVRQSVKRTKVILEAYITKEKEEKQKDMEEEGE